MAVPAHDERDFEFAKKHKLPRRFSIAIPADKFIENADRRDGSAALIFDSSKNMLVLYDKQLDKYNFPRGGMEKGETPEDAAIREGKEETGYKNLELLENLGCKESYFYAADKKVNRRRFLYGFSLMLKDKKKGRVSEEDKGRYEILWMSLKEAKEKLSFGEDRLFIDSIINPKNICFTGDGKLINSGKYSGLASEKAREEMAKWLEKNKLGKKTKTYRLHDWVISRQRYWGAPIPVIYCRKCRETQNAKRKTQNYGNDNQEKNFAVIDGVEHAIIPVPEKDLPVKLPELKDFLPTGDGKSPLAKARKWVRARCPRCRGEARRETDTMDTFVDSSWYFIRYADPKNKKRFADPAKMKKWLPVPLYIGGAEHNTMHLLYSRFFTKALSDLGYIHFNEPFTARRNHGIILGPDNQKMSKSRGNVVDPDAEVKKWGADSVRMYLAFMGPYDQNASWQMTGIVGLRRFLERTWKLSAKRKTQSAKPQRKTKNLENLFHKTIKKVTEDIENLRFNTAISALMILVNKIEQESQISISNYKLLITLLAPFAPHIAEEIWASLGHKTSIFKEKWPKFDPKLVREDEITLIIQVNGKVRDELKVPSEIGEREARDAALASEKIKKYIPITDHIRKIIFVPGRLINFVI
jgi:leucyl-tRNA synthetase